MTFAGQSVFSSRLRLFHKPNTTSFALLASVSPRREKASSSSIEEEERSGDIGWAHTMRFRYLDDDDDQVVAG